MKKTTNGEQEELRNFLNGLVLKLHEQSGGQVALALLPGDADYTGSSVYGNDSGLARIILTLLKTSTQHGRPTACAKCAAAWDAMQLATLALSGLEDGSCH